MQRLLQRLKEPFPDKESPKQNFMSLLSVGLFVSLFLFIIQPFGIHRAGDELIPICLGFGAVTVIFGWTYDLINRHIFRFRTDTPSWTLGKWILQSSGLIVWIAIGNVLFMNFLDGGNSFNTLFMLNMIFNTLIVGIFPIVFSGLMIQMKAIKSNEKQAAEIQTYLPAQTIHTSTISLSVDNQPLEMSIDELQYIEAMQNYVSVCYLENGQLKKKTLRATMAKILEMLKGTSVIQCHRSYLVNLDQIEKVSGNAQGLRLKLKEIVDVDIPVSRSFIPRFQEMR